MLASAGLRTMPQSRHCGPDRSADRQSVNLAVGRCTTIQELLLVLARARARGHAKLLRDARALVKQVS